MRPQAGRWGDGLKRVGTLSRLAAGYVLTRVTTTSGAYAGIVPGQRLALRP